MSDYRQDRVFFTQAVSHLEDFLRSPLVFYPLNIPSARHSLTPMSELTLGSFLLTEKKIRFLAAHGLIDKNPESEMQTAENIRKRWPALWSKKIRLEFPARIRQWSAALQDWSSEPGFSAAEYTAQAYQRAILELLQQDPEVSPNQRESLNRLDVQITSLTRQGAFIWPADFESAFPQQNYWFLYRQPRQKAEAI